jgi:hypothetical protein
MIRTNKNIKYSLDVARKQNVRCTTSLIESQIEKELEREFGPLLSEEEIEMERQKEMERRAKQDLALKKSRKKIFRMKKKVQAVQNIRQDRKGELSLTKPIIKDKGSNKTPEIKKIDLEY